MEYTTVSTQKIGNLVINLDEFLELLYSVDDILEASDLDEKYPEVEKLQEEMRLIIQILESSDGTFTRVSNLLMKLAFYINSIYNK